MCGADGIDRKAEIPTDARLAARFDIGVTIGVAHTLDDTGLRMPSATRS